MISCLSFPSIWTPFRAVLAPAWRLSRHPGGIAPGGMAPGGMARRDIAHGGRSPVGRYETIVTRCRVTLRSLSTSNVPTPDAPPSLQPSSAPDAPSRTPKSPPPEPTGTPESRREDLILVERCRNGDYGAFDLIVERYQNRIFNLCYWMLGDHDAASDAAQDAFIRAFRALPNFRGDSALGTWLHRIAVNVTLDAVAKRKKAPILASNLGGDDDDDSRDFDPADESATPEETSLAGERRMAVRAALASLPENHRAVLVLFDIQGHSYEEAAAALDVPLGTLKSRLSRARNALKEALESRRELFED